VPAELVIDPARVPRGLRGLPASLIARALRTQAAAESAASATAVAAAEADRRARELEQLAAKLQSQFLAERRAALPLGPLLARLGDDAALGWARAHVERRVRELASAAPEWLSFVSVSTGEHVRVNQRADVGAVRRRLREGAAAALLPASA
jgi:hypothetical protein